MTKLIITDIKELDRYVFKPVLHFKFIPENISGRIVRDLSGMDNHGTMSSILPIDPQFGAKFSNEVIAIANKNLLPTRMIIRAKIKPVGNNSQGMILTNHTNYASDGFMLMVEGTSPNSSIRAFASQGDQIGDYKSNNATDNGQGYDITFVTNNTVNQKAIMKLNDKIFETYNGKLNDSSIYRRASTDALYIGGYGSYRYHGYIYEIAVYDLDNYNKSIKILLQTSTNKYYTLNNSNEPTLVPSDKIDTNEKLKNYIIENGLYVDDTRLPKAIQDIAETCRIVLLQMY